MNLSDKMNEWGLLQTRLAKLEEEIKQEVKALGKTQEVIFGYGKVVASYRKSSTNGSFDYKSITMEIEPEPEIVEKHTTTTVSIDYKAIVEEVGASDELKSKYYNPPANSEPSVSVKLK